MYQIPINRNTPLMIFIIKIETWDFDAKSDAGIHKMTFPELSCVKMSNLNIAVQVSPVRYPDSVRRGEGCGLISVGCVHTFLALQLLFGNQADGFTHDADLEKWLHIDSIDSTKNKNHSCSHGVALIFQWKSAGTGFRTRVWHITGIQKTLTLPSGPPLVFPWAPCVSYSEHLQRVSVL